MRVQSVRERSIRAIMAHLMNLQVVNGFNFSLQKIERKRAIPQRSTISPIIFLMFGPTIVDGNYNNHQYREEAGVEAWFFLQNMPDGSDDDTEYNLFISDIIKLLGNYEVKDNTHPDAEGRIVDIDIIGHQPYYSDNFQGQTRGKLDFRMKYTYLRDNPYKWDIQDDEVSLI